MSWSDRELVTDSDPHSLLFEPGDDSDFDDEPLIVSVRRRPRPGPAPEPRGSGGGGHRQATRTRRRSRNRRLMTVVAVLIVAVLVVAGWLIARPIYHYFHPADYAGSGTGQAIVTVQANDDATQIGQELRKQGVVASVRAFTDAASKNSAAQQIQPGSYKLRKHMSAKNAIALMLNPAARIDSDVVIIEGATTIDVRKRLTAAPCSANAQPAAVCGLGLSAVSVQKALSNVAALGLPTDYTVDGKTPNSAEGFLYPATYPFDDTTTANLAIQDMITRFTEQARSTDFTARAAALHLTPYQELTLASMAQAEAKYPADMAKVTRVILNRLALKQPLKVDAVSVYGAELKGIDPQKINFATFDSPYNTYLHAGLPPTPIGNPGAEAMQGAAHPSAGNWLYYVNADAAGHLFFTNSAAAFAAAQLKCYVNHWGCAKPGS